MIDFTYDSNVFLVRPSTSYGTFQLIVQRSLQPTILALCPYYCIYGHPGGDVCMEPYGDTYNGHICPIMFTQPFVNVTHVSELGVPATNTRNTWPFYGDCTALVLRNGHTWSVSLVKGRKSSFNNLNG